jgi:hypothetical protein
MNYGHFVTMAAAAHKRPARFGSEYRTVEPPASVPERAIIAAAILAYALVASHWAKGVK